ncbi:FecR domain-containing protein [Fulvivirgaceae bacterium PWU4]|uniref:FecR domain-containing protein n=1 Tax=Chryseosolibacter histidini TaxID=2782349 RepID=A0AAP2GGX4_9BACT|nr:FecR domain-containing protein [Chryseosolibacter histidini]MBT1695409.1 FecR domain-containing protein [Chryseosolibacter histidini]
MTKAEFLAILEKNLDGTATEAEQKLLDDFYRHQLAQSQQKWTFTEKERIRLEVFESLNRAIDEDVRQQRRARFARIWRVAASIAVVLAVGLGLYLARFASKEIQYLTIITHRGEQKTVTLPDGSRIWLNAESSITYPEEFTALETRNVQLKGEAFFEVARDEAKPFAIRSGDLITTVLGTSFNIRDYPEDQTIAVTVATGKVKIETAGDQHQQTESQLLVPGEQGLYNKQSASIAKMQVKLEKYLAWQGGTILLEGVSLKEATDILSRRYDAEFVFKNPALETCTIDGKFRNDKLENILENIRFLMGIEYRIGEGNKVIIDGESCH